MQKRQLRNNDLRVCELVFGTMTFGEQNSESDAVEQLDPAVDARVDFMDTPKMYPLPPWAETHGRPRMTSIQNPNSLLSGKYLNGARPAGAHLTLFDRLGRYSNDEALRTTAEYCSMAGVRRGRGRARRATQPESIAVSATPPGASMRGTALRGSGVVPR